MVSSDMVYKQSRVEQPHLGPTATSGTSAHISTRCHTVRRAEEHYTETAHNYEPADAGPSSVLSEADLDTGSRRARACHPAA